MIKLTDEILMAYVDGELDTNLTEEVGKAIEENPDILAKVQMFRESTILLKGIYDEPLREEIPEKLLKTITTSLSDNKKRGLLNRLCSFFSVDFSRRPAFVFAMLACLAIGLVMGFILTDHMMPGRDPYATFIGNKELSRGLDTTLSGKSFRIAENKITVTPLMTFIDSNREYCRQFEVRLRHDGEGELIQCIACRQKSGEWKTKVIIWSGSLMSSRESSTTPFQPASSGDLMESIVNEMMVSAPISIKQEKRLIKQAWHTNPEGQ